MIQRYANLRRGLVGAWCPSVSGGGPTVPDLSGYRRNATATGVPFVAAGSGLSALLNTASSGSQELVIPSSVSIVAGDYTLSMWVRVNAYNGTYCTLFEKFSGGVREFGFFFDGTGAASYAEVGGSPSVLSGSQAGSFSLGVWQHFSMVRIGVRTTFYRNAIARGIADNIAGTATVSAAWSFGQSPSGVTKPNANYDDIRFYTRALRPAELATLASARGVGLAPMRTRRPSVGSVFYVNVGGTWKTAKSWINVGGTWKAGTPKTRVAGAWK
jgi:hypothetical protein